MKRLEFSDKQKALIYERDKWICAFSWKILWILHYWASCLWDTDWVDHIKPSMKGGDNSIENWICASSFFNSKKRDNSNDNKFLFKDWKTTQYFYTAQWFYTDELFNHLKYFKNIHFSDWFFNRALQNLMISIEIKHNPYDTKWNLIKRDFNYWINATNKRLIEWKKLVSNNDIISFKTRLYQNDTNILWEDQKLMLELITANWIDNIKDIVNSLFPFYENSLKYFSELSKVNNNKDDVILFKTKVQNEIYLNNRDKEILIKAVELTEIL